MVAADLRDAERSRLRALEPTEPDDAFGAGEFRDHHVRVGVRLAVECEVRGVALPRADHEASGAERFGFDGDRREEDLLAEGE